ncbi:MAG: hypothetical protein BMS9Abin28_1243 [Anaerolineae bacterium]|nr:MAG: hypothetical protein BMS9Abin28_1243 [Anaerolineae bacterium]
MHTRKIVVSLAVLTAIPLSACQSSAEPEEAELGTGAAFVQTVEVEERDGEYWAVVEGWYPDACSTYGGSGQEVEGDTIHLTITFQRPEDMACAQVLTDMTEEIQLDTDDLEPGEYTLIVNVDNATTTFTVS